MEEKVFNCGIDCLLGDVDTEFCHEYLRYEILANNLVGEYAENGEYTITDEVKNILVGCAKKIKEKSIGNCFKLEANISSFKLNFELSTYKENDELISELYLLEKVNDDNIDFCHNHKTFIAKYADNDDIYFVDKMFKVFNIFENDDKVKDFNQEDYCRKLIEKLKYNKSLHSDLVEFGHDYYKDYIKEVIKMLEGMDQSGRFVLKKFSTFLKGVQNFGKNKGDYYKAMIRLNQLILSSGIKFNDIQKKKLDDLKKQVFSIEEVSFKKKNEKQKEEKKKPVVVAKKNDNKGGKGKDKGKDNNKNKDKNKKVEKKAKNLNEKKSVIEPKLKKINNVNWNNGGSLFVQDTHEKNNKVKENFDDMIF